MGLVCGFASCAGHRRLSLIIEEWCGEVDCLSTGHNDVDRWVFVWSEVSECIEEGLHMRVFWTKAHSTLEEKAKMSPENRQVAWASEIAD